MTPLTCRQCGGDVIVFDDEFGLYESHRDGADHAPDTERLGSLSEVAEREGTDIADIIQRQTPPLPSRA